MTSPLAQVLADKFEVGLRWVNGIYPIVHPISLWYLPLYASNFEWFEHISPWNYGLSSHTLYHCRQ